MRSLLLALTCATLVVGCSKKADPPSQKSPQTQKQSPERIAPRTVSFCGKGLPLTATKAYCRGQGIVKASPLSDLSKLQLLDVSTTKRLDGVGSLAGLSGLRQLVLFQTEVDVRQLAKLTQLKELKIVKAPYAKDLAPLASLRGLTYLRCSHCAVADLAFLGKLTRLRALTLSHSSAIRDFKIIGGLAELRYLNLNGTAVVDLRWIAGLSKLERLSLASTKVRDLRPLAKLASLRELNLSGTRARDLSVLPRLKNLDRLDLRGIPGLRRLAPLRKMTWLRTLTVPAKALSRRQLARLQKALPRTEVRAQ